MAREPPTFSEEHRIAHRWIRLRMVGWLLVGAWQVLSLASEFAPIVDLNQRPVRIMGKVLGVLGLFLVAYGFERLMALQHDHPEAHPFAQRLRRLRIRRAREG